MNEQLFVDPKLLEFYKKYYSRFYYSRVCYDLRTGEPIPFKPLFFFNVHKSGMKPFFNESIIQKLYLHNEECTLGTDNKGFCSVRLFYNEKTVCHTLDSLKRILEQLIFISQIEKYSFDINSINDLFNFALVMNEKKIHNPFSEEQIKDLVYGVWRNRADITPIINKRMSIISDNFYPSIPNFRPENKPNYVRAELRRIRGNQTRIIIKDSLPDVIKCMKEENKIINKRSIAEELLPSFPIYTNSNSIRNILTDLLPLQNDTRQQVHLTGKGNYTGLMHEMAGREKPALQRMEEVINQLILNKEEIDQLLIIQNGISKRTVERYYKKFKQRITEHNLNVKKEDHTEYFSDGIPIPNLQHIEENKFFLYEIYAPILLNNISVSP